LIGIYFFTSNSLVAWEQAEKLGKPVNQTMAFHDMMDYAM